MRQTDKPAATTASIPSTATLAAVALLALCGPARAQQGPPPAGPGGGPPAGGQGAAQPGEQEGYAMIRDAAPVLPPAANAAVPRDPRNLEGTWFHDQPLVFRITRDMYEHRLPYTPKGQAILDRRVKATYEDTTPFANASAECKPPGQQWQLDLNMPFQVFQAKREIDFLFEEYHGAWRIRMDQPHRASGPREYFGDSVGHWDGDTLVVDTIHYRRGLWLDVDGTPASEDAHVVHRIRKVEVGTPHLEIVTSVDDPKLYTRTWSVVRTYEWRPDMASFAEYNCEHQVGGPGGVSRYGLVPEPDEDD